MSFRIYNMEEKDINKKWEKSFMMLTGLNS